MARFKFRVGHAGSPCGRLAGLVWLAGCAVSGCTSPVPDATLDGWVTGPLRDDASADGREGADATADASATTPAADSTGDAAYPAPDATARDAAPAPDLAFDAAHPADAAIAPDDGAAPSADAAAPELSDAGAVDASAVDASTQNDAALPPFEVSKLPLQAPDRVWTYIEFPDTHCRDGSPAGIALSLRKPSTKLAIYLEGGIYCFDGPTCLLNPTRVDDLLFNSARRAPTEGIFDRNNPQNPLRDWNIVYVPYCSGDGHGGTKTTPTDVPAGPRQQRFEGQLNLTKFLRRVVPTFPDATDVLLTGMSAGGFGVLQNVVLVQRAFPQLRVRYINDSGPPLSKAVIPECIQEKLRTLWGLDQGALAACGNACPRRDDYLQDNALFLAQRFADRPSGFIDALEDEPQRMLLGVGMNNCRGTFLLDTLPARPYREDLLAYRDKLRAFPASGSFIPPGTQHTWLRTNAFYSGSAQGIKLVDWFAKIVNAQAAGHVGP